MKISPIVVLTLPLLGSTWTMPLAEAREGQPAELIVHTYNYAGVHPDDLAAARRHAETIFSDASLTISWIDCRITGRDAVDILPTCRTDLRPDEVMLRIMSGGAPIVDRITSLGFSLVNRENAHAAWLSSVFADRVVTLAAQAGIHPALLLGRAIAHEIGHLLIGSTDHASLGLMRAFWSHRELVQTTGSEWAFLEKEATAIRSSLSVHQYVAGEAIPRQLAMPPNIAVSSMYRPLFESMLRQSPTFRRQVMRIAAEASLTVHVAITRPPPGYDVRATTRLTRNDRGHLSAAVQIAPKNVEELIAHEFEHIIEQLDGVDLAAHAAQRHTGVTAIRHGRDMFETRRAKRAGLKVVCELGL